MRIKKEEGATIVYIEGDKTKPEKAETIIKFPTGEVSIMRTTDDKYWVHFHVNKNEQGEPTTKLSKARLDITGLDVNNASTGDFAHPDLYHLAILTEKA